MLVEGEGEVASFMESDYHEFMKLPALTPIWSEILSELLIGLAATWFAIVLAVPAVLPLPSTKGFLFLTINLLFGIVALLAAKRLREGKRRKGRK